MNTKDFTLKIIGHTPDTLPMGRIGQYIVKLAALMGQSDDVFIGQVKKGSVAIGSRVHADSAVKVSARLKSIQGGQSQSEVKRAYSDINELLRADKAYADLYTGQSKIIAFPGCKQELPKPMGPYLQPITRSGILVKIGGADKTAHAHIKDPENNTWCFEVDKALARELCHLLFDKVVRLHGQALATRSEHGVWDYQKLTANRFEVIDGPDLMKAISDIRHITGSAKGHFNDPMAELCNMRDGLKGIH